ncbi:MAG TPA: AAA family ATPase [Thermoanaerobaculia bacterium]|nr:AAA family ATPase [Thermoanaerobaculia bacterium]
MAPGPTFRVGPGVMRIAIAGAHRTGKTTLIEELSRALPDHGVVDEPYYLLEEEGYEFAEMPSLEDFEVQLERSIECVGGSEEDQIFDRCPADMLAYLIAHPDSDGDVKAWLSRVRNAMQRLDLVVFVPVEDPDRIIVSDPEESDLRQRVDEELREIVVEDRWDFGVEAIEVAGTPRERARQVLAYLGAR